ncbi:dUTP nucleotidohydrolase [Bacillus phage DirtyBetty]|uniref:dUTP nucleotidohydrolase n=2 Tax=Wphvirus megatron TaxID=1987728 RepID=A0A1B1PB34_9CAUD|nr:dUTP nucleotihydrolase [Bacillus phage Eyuki]YP_009285076.1 dUTP nucleotidohydrolase [Bacillus phage DirtyBetty]ALA46789.1 dUTP nucleotihydrolase [Bacillus phage Eyuki]ANT41368.1 dUTP nucleotidohydrolase [Bacillus phage DirtyBetty]
MTDELKVSELPVKVVLGDGAKIPKNAHGDDFCDDVYAAEGRLVPPATFKSILVPTNVTTEFDAKYGLKLNTRSGMGYKTPLILANATGIIEASYRGTIGVLLRNTFVGSSLVDFVFDTSGNRVPYTEIPEELIAQAREFFEEESEFLGYGKPESMEDFKKEMNAWLERSRTGEFGEGNISRIQHLLNNGEQLNMKDAATWVDRVAPKPSAKQRLFYNLFPVGTVMVEKGERIAQIHFQEIVRAKYEEITKEGLSETARGDKKYGGTGVK